MASTKLIATSRLDRIIDDDTTDLNLAFMDVQIGAHPELITSADEAQLDRLTQLLVNVKV